jgi:hypothetical protein
MTDRSPLKVELRNTGFDAGYGASYPCKDCDLVFGLMTALLVHEYDVHERPRPEGPFHLTNE